MAAGSTPPQRAGREAIAAALAAGDDEAFARTLDGCYGRMLRLARAVTGGDASTRDAVREAWLKALAERTPPDGMPSFEAWLFALTLSALERQNLPSAATPGGTDLDPADFEIEADRWAGHWTDEAMPEPWPDSGESAAVRRRALAASIERLSPLLAALVVLNDVERLAPVDITAVLGLTEDARIGLLHEARTKLRRAAAEELAGAGTPT